MFVGHGMFWEVQLVVDMGVDLTTYSIITIMIHSVTNSLSVSALS